MEEGAGGGAQQDAVDALGEVDAVGAEPLVQALQRGGAVDQAAAVPVELALVGEQSDHGDPAFRRERQETVVLQQHHRLLGGLLGERPVLGGVEGPLTGVRVTAGVELAEPEPYRQLPPDRRVDVLLGQQALVQRPLMRATTVELSVPWSVKLSTPARSAAAVASSCVSK